MSRDFLIHNGKLTSDLDADGNLIKNLPGVAHLVDGKVPSDELPSYVDDVLEYATRSSFPETGERGKIYIALDTNKQYRWGGTTYVEIAGDIPAPSTATPAMDGTGAAGTSAAFARGDHVHPTDTSRMAASATGADIAVSGTDATKISAALAGKLDESGGEISGDLRVVGKVQVGSSSNVNAAESMSVGHFNDVGSAYSAAVGYGLLTRNKAEYAHGEFNASHKSSGTIGDAGNTLSSIGFGTADNARKNAVETMQDGKTFIYGLGDYDGTNPTNATDLASAVNAKANRAANPTAGNLAALDANGNPTDAGWTAGELARYSLVTKTIDNGAVTLDDRASNIVSVSATLSPNTLTINFPTAATSDKVRDFAMRLNIAAGVTAPEIAWPQGVTLENNDGEVPEIADGGTGGSSTILYFSETENNETTAKFLVKGETLTAIAQA